MASKNLMQMSTDIVKLDRFDGGSFKRWQKKMQFLLATLKVAYVLTKPYLEESENKTLAASRECLKFKNDDFICRRHILNAMSDPLFDVYQNYSTAKELWNALEERYFTEDATTFSLEEEKSWRVDSGATRHVCNDQTMFKTYEPSDSMLYMGNQSTTQVEGKGKINLVFTSGNTLTLKNVLHVLEVYKKLVSGSLLNKFGFKLVFESDKFILSKGGKFVGKGYHTDGMFKLNIKDVVNSSVNDVNMTEISDVNDASASITDRDGEYYDPRYFQSTGIVHQVTAPYTPQQNDPQTYSKAMKSHDSSSGKEAVNDEMASIIGNNTWIFVDLPPGSKAIKSK
uniref:Potassium channel AKT2/3-like n=1 Tax=Tanacetum cinerariifolium TaxID=118510 RepID=A0A699H4V5_TANCI|nr:potassium channel AKT2/3-like [Tanacetum cinerariifolium]